MDYTDLLAYQKSFLLAMKVFEISKRFPVEERYALTDQIRRSSRSVTVNIAEGYRKRRYVPHYTSKLSDADTENTETQVWLRFALACQYVSSTDFQELFNQTEEIGRLIHYMMSNPGKFGSGQ